MLQNIYDIGELKNKKKIRVYFFVSVGVAYTIKNSQTQFVYDGNIYKNNCAYFYINA
jgi:hypothetical protein